MEISLDSGISTSSESRMNRLILIGNGFDLAHNLRTGYKDFLLWYIENCVEKSSDNLIYDDKLINIKSIYLSIIGTSIFPNIHEYLKFCYLKGFENTLENENIDISDYQRVTNPFAITLKGEFITNLFSSCSESAWVDIENEYYRCLLKITKENGGKDEIHSLNSQLSCIISKLEEYFSSLPKPNLNNEFSKIITSPIKSEDLSYKIKMKSIRPAVTMILNFNYTDTVELYLSRLRSYFTNISVNYIHGKLNKKDNPLIFGFGDELDEDYPKLEENSRWGMLDYIKSFWYFKTSNYHDLIRFIDSKDFQVYIMGHSCGLSDRTMLNMIFENENCKSIKIFYYGNKEINNYTVLTQEISRHFRDKPQMRRKIVPLDKSSSMPQNNTSTQSQKN